MIDEDLRALVGKELVDDVVVSGLSRFIPKPRRNEVQGADGKPVEITRGFIRAQRHLAGLPTRERDGDTLRLDDLERLRTARCANEFVDANSLPDELRKSSFAQIESGWLDVDELRVECDTHSSRPPNLSSEELRQAILSAMASWNAADIGVRFVESSGQSPHVFVRWTSQSGDPHRTLTASLVAHGDFPPPHSEHVTSQPLPVCFSLAQSWGIDGHIGRYDVESIALHEFGHCLGLRHKGVGSIMYASVRKGKFRTIDPLTRNAARSLYDG